MSKQHSEKVGAGIHKISPTLPSLISAASSDVPMFA
jgi:hypothetical protein